MSIAYEPGRRDYRSTRADSRTPVIEAARNAERAGKLRAPLVETPADKAAAISSILRRNGSIATEAQNSRVLAVLREVGETTSMSLQELADVRHPPARALQLRQAGHVIVGRWVRQISALGHVHRTMSYCLTRERAAEATS